MWTVTGERAFFARGPIGDLLFSARRGCRLARRLSSHGRPMRLTREEGPFLPEPPLAPMSFAAAIGRATGY